MYDNILTYCISILQTVTNELKISGREALFIFSANG